MKFFTAFIFALVFVSPLCYAQYNDTVYLRDGSIIKGEITETIYTTDLRIDAIKVRIEDGSVLTFTGDKIQKIQHESPQTSKQITNYKNSGLACILSLLLFPGIGQFYNEQPGKGAFLLGFGVLGAAMLIDGSKKVTTYEYYWGGGYTDYKIYHTNPKNEGEATLGAIIYLFTWIYSATDAYDSAKKINESLGLSVTPNKISLCYRF